MTNEIVRREEGLVAKKAVFSLVICVDEVLARSEVCALSCFVREADLAVLAIPSLVDGLVE